MHFVYVLYSPSLNRFYVGESANAADRLIHHQAGHQRYTRRATDWTQVFLKSTDSRAEALLIEKSIKSSKSRKTVLRWIHGSDNQIPDAVWQRFPW